MAGVFARVAPGLLKALGILSDTTVRGSEVNREDLKPNWKSEKRLISVGNKQAQDLRVFQRV